MGCYINIESQSSVIDTIKKSYLSMYAAEAKVADFILNNPEKALEANVSETAEYSGVSDATVVRFCKKLGYEGFYQLKLQLSHDFGKNSSLAAKKSPSKDTAKDIVMGISDVLVSVAEKIDSEKILKCAEAINNCDIVYVIGRGHSKILATDILFRLSRLGVRTLGGNFVETDIESICYGTEKDVLICVSHTGETKRTIQAMEIANQRNMTTIALTDSEKNPLTQGAKISISSGVICGAEFDNGVNTYIYMLAIIDAMMNYVDKRDNDTSFIENVVAESRI